MFSRYRLSSSRTLFFLRTLQPVFNKKNIGCNNRFTFRCLFNCGSQSSCNYFFSYLSRTEVSFACFRSTIRSVRGCNEFAKRVDSGSIVSRLSPCPRLIFLLNNSCFSKGEGGGWRCPFASSLGDAVGFWIRALTAVDGCREQSVV